MGRTRVVELVQHDAPFLQPRPQELSHFRARGVVEEVKALDPDKAVPGEPFDEERSFVRRRCADDVVEGIRKSGWRDEGEVCESQDEGEGWGVGKGVEG